MAEDTRLKNRLNVETQLNSQSLQPQNPPQTIHAEKLFKEAEDYNNIGWYYNGSFTPDCFGLSFI